jgi:endonuclease/exonuclease/phosphatase family metal-dependent hydrolase
MANLLPKKIFVVDFRNSQPISMGQAILYKKSRFYQAEHIKRWFSNTPFIPSDDSDGFGYILNGICLLPVLNTKIISPIKPLWIYNTHFPLNEEQKTKCCLILKELIDKDKTFILCGDFNFFPDFDGDKQRNSLGFKDLGKDAKTLKGSISIEGTFIGYTHDLFHADFKKMVSRLDHVFSSENVEKVEDSILVNKTMISEVDNDLSFEFDNKRRYPSDHLPLLVKIKISN